MSRPSLSGYPARALEFGTLPRVKPFVSAADISRIMKEGRADADEDPVSELRELYVETLRETILSGRAHVGALRSGKGDAAAAMSGLAVEFHGLNGSGATFGFPRVSEIGATGEAILRALSAAAPDLHRDAAIAALSFALDDLAAVATRAGRGEREPAEEPPSLAALRSAQRSLGAG
jgi:chemotaxis protein histidine kinase CheA